jgi:transposase InsO family protein
MAAMLSRELHVPVNRKHVQRIYRMLNQIAPSKTKNEIIRSAAKLIKATRPYELWETDTTYVACGIDGWCDLFNVIDVFQREWLGYAFETSAVKEHAIMSVNNTLVSHPEIDVGGLTLRCDNGPQYRSNAFRESMRTLGIKIEYIFANTPEQNGHVESFHDPQEGVSLADRLPELPRSRDGDSGRVQRLQPGKDPLSTGLSDPLRIPAGMEGEELTMTTTETMRLERRNAFSKDWVQSSISGAGFFVDDASCSSRTSRCL